MVSVQYIGSLSEKNKLKSKLSGNVVFMDNASADCIVLEINSRNDLNKVSVPFSKPTYFYLTKANHTLKTLLASFNAKDIIHSFYNKDLIATILNRFNEDRTPRNKKPTNISTDTIIRLSENIPALPTIIGELIKLTEDDKSSMHAMVGKIKKDQGLTSTLLRMVNSPFFGFNQEITGIDRAAILLGVNTIKKLATAVSMKEFYKKNFVLYNTTGTMLWMHGYNVASICGYIASLKTSIDAESLYLAGLLHDVGKIVLVDFLRRKTLTPDDEKEQTGYTHTDVAGIILTKWKISSKIVNAIKEHHNSPNFSRNDFSIILYYSNILDKEKNINENLVKEFAKKLHVDYHLLLLRVRKIRKKIASTWA